MVIPQMDQLGCVWGGGGGGLSSHSCMNNGGVSHSTLVACRLECVCLTGLWRAYCSALLRHTLQGRRALWWTAVKTDCTFERPGSADTDF